MYRMHIDDEWGGIDEKIGEAVAVLNRLGITTTGSCEGHADRSSPAPWITVSPPGWPGDSDRSSDEYKNWEAEKEKLLKRTRDLIDEFYKDRETDPKVKIGIDDSADAGFWIYSGRGPYTKWREGGRKRMVAKSRGEVVLKPQLSSAEIEERRLDLPRYHAELKAFTDFLKEKLES